MSIITPETAGPRKFVKMQSINVFVLYYTLVYCWQVVHRSIHCWIDSVRRKLYKLGNQSISSIMQKVNVEITTNVNYFSFIFQFFRQCSKLL